MKLFIVFLAMASSFAVDNPTRDDIELRRSKRDLIHWNRQSNNSYKLRTVHYSIIIDDLNQSCSYLDQIKAFLAKQSDPESRRITRRKRHHKQQQQRQQRT